MMQADDDLVYVTQDFELTYRSADASPLGGRAASALTLRPVPADGATGSMMSTSTVQDLAAQVNGARAEVAAAESNWTIRLPAGAQPNHLTVSYALAGAVGPGDTFGLVTPLELVGLPSSAAVSIRAANGLDGRNVVGLTCPTLPVSRCSRADGDGRVAVIPAGGNPSVILAVARP
jgi:hypothetical protein